MESILVCRFSDFTYVCIKRINTVDLVVLVLRGEVVKVIFCFKKKTAYEMRISDWSSDVCSSDRWRSDSSVVRSFSPAKASAASTADTIRGTMRKIGRASCRERVCQYV